MISEGGQGALGGIENSLETLFGPRKRIKYWYFTPKGTFYKISNLRHYWRAFIPNHNVVIEWQNFGVVWCGVVWCGVVTS
jgi:hypothetical protein